MPPAGSPPPDQDGPWRAGLDGAGLDGAGLDRPWRAGLDGPWRAVTADDELRRTAFDPAHDDSSWPVIAVPGHWRSHPEFATSDGPVVYRHRFETSAGADRPGERWWLVFAGVFYQADVWLDGGYLGDVEGTFFPHQFEVTDQLAARREHLLAVEVACTPPTDRRRKRSITGVWHHWDCLDPSWNPGGLWRPVTIERTGPVRLRRLKVLCREADPTRAVLALRAELDASETAEAGRTALRTRVRRAGPDGGGTLVEEVTDAPLAAGTNVVEWTVTVDQPALWWPWALGEQPLHDVDVTVELDGAASDGRTVRTGLRQVAVRDWIWSVNGERLFVKGANLGPSALALGDVPAEHLERDLRLARQAGLDLVRVHGHVSRPELYEAADRSGMLLWQDFPLQWGYQRQVRDQARRQAREAVYALGHHPSIALWCAHNEPFAIDSTAELDLRTLGRVFAAQQLPTWNKTVLDRSVKRALAKSDPTRPVIAHSGVWPHLPQLEGTDSHLYFGWYHGQERQFPGFLHAWPRMARFVSEFGAQAVPEDAAFMEPERWPDLDWDRLQRFHGIQADRLRARVPTEGHATFASWQRATQRYQAELLKHHVEALRRLKYRPTGGFCMFSLADAWPAVTWAVLGHDRAPKLGYHALAEACRPVIVVADRPPAAVRPGDGLALDVHVVSDLRRPLTGLTVDARVSWPGGAHAWRWEGDLAADTCERVGTIRLVVPETAGELVLDLALRGDGVEAANRYVTAVAGR